MKAEIYSMSLRREVDWSMVAPAIAFAEIGLPDIQATVKGVMLVYKDGGFIACAPMKRENEKGIHWSTRTEWCRKLGGELYDLYRRMGGEKPPGHKAIEAAKAGDKERRVFPAKWQAVIEKADEALAVLEAAKPKVPVRTIEEIDAAMPVAEMGLSIDAGLARTLGVAS